MPKAKTEPTTDDTTASGSKPYPVSPKHTWSKTDKNLLFDHVTTHGETGWGNAVPGKSALQSREQWKRILCPYIRKTCGLDVNLVKKN